MAARQRKSWRGSERTKAREKCWKRHGGDVADDRRCVIRQTRRRAISAIIAAIRTESEQGALTGFLAEAHPHYRRLVEAFDRLRHRQGLPSRRCAKLALTYQNERFSDRVVASSAEFGSDLIFQCDVAEDAQIEQLFVDLGKHWEGLDGLVHSIAYAPAEAIEGDFLEGINAAFRIAHDVSSYSYPALAKAARRCC